MGKHARRSRRPAAGLVRSGREVLDAGDDGHRPEPRAERPLGRGARQADRRRRPVRARRVPPVHPDVRQDRDGRAGRRVRARARRGQGSARARTRRTPTWTPTTCSGADRASSRRSTASTRARSSRRTRRSSSGWRSTPCSARGTASARDRLPAAEQDQRRPRDRGQRAWRWCSATAARTRAPASRSPATPSTGEKVPYGDYLANAQGEDVVAGIRNTLAHRRARAASTPIRTAELMRRAWTRSRATTGTCATSSSRSRRASSGSCRRGSASGPRSPSGSWPFDMLDEGLIDEDEALLRVDADRLEELFKRRVKADGAHADREGPERVARRGHRRGGVHGRRRRGARERRREGDPRAPRDHARTTTTA